MSEKEIDEMSWCEFVSSIEEPKLVEYLKERRLYVNELVKTAEGGEEECVRFSAFWTLERNFRQVL